MIVQNTVWFEMFLSTNPTEMFNQKIVYVRGSPFSAFLFHLLNFPVAAIYIIVCLYLLWRDNYLNLVLHVPAKPALNWFESLFTGYYHAKCCCQALFLSDCTVHTGSFMCILHVKRGNIASYNY